MRLNWDSTGEHYYETGISKCVLYPIDGGSYPRGIAWNGLTNVTESMEGGEPNNFYADDIKYLELRSAEDFTATLEAYTYPYAFAVCAGIVEPIPGVSIGQQTRKHFGLSYQTKIGNDMVGEDYGYKIHLVYNATVGPSEKQYQTISDSPEAVTFSWDIATSPVIMPFNKPSAFIIIDSTKCLPEHLQALEDILYGTDETDARLPSPAEIADLLGGAASFFYIDRPAGHLKFDGPSSIFSNFYMHIYDSGHLYYTSPEDDESLDVYLEDGRLYIEEVNNGN